MCKLQYYFFKGFLVLLCFARISVSQENEELLLKPIDATLTIDCPGCNNSRGCIILINGMNTSQNIYTLTDDGNLIIPANDIRVYGTLRCGSSSGELKTYKICPPQPEIGRRIM